MKCLLPWRLRVLAASCMALAVLAGCSTSGSAQADDAAAVTNTVRAYNDDLARAFAEMDMNELSGSATQRQAEEEFSLMAALGEGRLRMLATLVRIEFGDVRFPAEGIAQVDTTEIWDYDHISLDTSETVRAERNVTYSLRYDLVLQGDRWLVDAVTSLDGEATGGSRETTP